MVLCQIAYHAFDLFFRQPPSQFALQSLSSSVSILLRLSGVDIKSRSKDCFFESFFLDEHFELLPNLILHVDVRVPLVPLNNESSDVPILDYWWLNDILEMQIEAFDAME